MDLTSMQARIDAIPWYHEFDFGNGLKARSTAEDVVGHRVTWKFIEKQLEGIDFRGKTVLDIGCWDGYWSFYAERRGARVLATDDRTQNWSDGNGLLLARELYGSSIEVNQDVSVYRLAELGRKFDVVLFLGVYYHLFDPFYAFTQIRHCCHERSLVVVEGPEAIALRPGAALNNFADHCCEWLPTQEALEQVLRASYFAVDAHLINTPSLPGKVAPPGWRWRLAMCARVLSGQRARITEAYRDLEFPANSARRICVRCTPWEGANELHAYYPPFGLHRYDSRFRHLEPLTMAPRAAA